MVRISKKVIKSCKKMTDYYVRIVNVNVPKLKIIQLELPCIDFAVENQFKVVLLTSMVELESQLVFLKMDEIPELLKEVILDPIEDSDEIVQMKADYEKRCDNDKFFQRKTMIFISTRVYPRVRVRDSRIPQLKLI